MTPKATVAIPVRNGAPWVRDAIESALAQTLPNLEVVVWNDGSEDGTSSVLSSFGDRIRTEEHLARGGNSARNGLLHLARGEWVQYLDADDYLLADKIECQLREAEAATNSADILYSPVRMEKWQGGQAFSGTDSALDPASDIITQWITWQLPQTGGTLWRRSSLAALLWKEDQPCCQEHELYLRAIQAGMTFQFCPTVGAVYRIWSEETVSRKDPLLVIRQRTILIDRMLNWLQSTGRMQPKYLAAAGQACFEMARTWAKYDLPAAAAYFNERREAGLILLQGPAAPTRYRILTTLLGFERSERLAERMR